MNLGGPAKVKCKKSMELYRDKAGPPIVKLFNFLHFTNKVALFHSLSNFKTQLKTFLFRKAFSQTCEHKVCICLHMCANVVWQRTEILFCKTLIKHTKLIRQYITSDILYCVTKISVLLCVLILFQKCLQSALFQIFQIKNLNYSKFYARNVTCFFLSFLKNKQNLHNYGIK